MRRSFLNRPVSLLGQSLPMAALLLASLAVVGSAMLALLHRSGIPSLTLLALSPDLVPHGQIWRMATWGFFEVNGLNLVFGALLLVLIGRDLAAYWGGLRYLAVSLAVVLIAGGLTTAIGLVWSDVGRTRYLSVWPLVDALIIAWSLLFPSRTILVMFVLPAAGRNLLYLTVGMATLFAVMDGFNYFVPHFLAMGAMYAYIRGGAIVAAQFRLNRLLTPKRANPGLKVVDGGLNKDDGKGPRDSGWVH